MRIAILSDIHDHRHHLATALERVRAAGAERLLCLGDLCSPFIVKDLGEGFDGPIDIVFGNNDGDLFRITRTAAGFDGITLHGEVADLTIDGKRFILTHFDTIATLLAEGGAFDVVCYGHNHRFAVERRVRTLMINPGEVMGGLSGTASFVLLDTGSMETERVVIS